MRRLLAVLALLLALYVGTYAVLSWHGRYVSFVRVRVWQPYGVEYAMTMQGLGFTVQLNPLGYVFLPMIWLDRQVWHRDRGLV